MGRFLPDWRDATERKGLTHALAVASEFERARHDGGGGRAAVRESHRYADLVRLRQVNHRRRVGENYRFVPESAFVVQSRTGSDHGNYVEQRLSKRNPSTLHGVIVAHLSAHAYGRITIARLSIRLPFSRARSKMGRSSNERRRNFDTELNLRARLARTGSPATGVTHRLHLRGWTYRRRLPARDR